MTVWAVLKLLATAAVLLGGLGTMLWSALSPDRIGPYRSFRVTVVILGRTKRTTGWRMPELDPRRIFLWSDDVPQNITFWTDDEYVTWTRGWVLSRARRDALLTTAALSRV